MNSKYNLNIRQHKCCLTIKCKKGAKNNTALCFFLIDNLKVFQLFSTHRLCVPYISPQRDGKTKNRRERL